MRCPICEGAGQVSKVYCHGGGTTLMAYTVYYDEDGVLHDHDPNTHTDSYSCSEGHAWTEKRIKQCPAEGCGYGTVSDGDTIELSGG